MGPALVGVDRVGEGVEGLREPRVPLKGHLHLGVLLLPLEGHDPGMQDVLRLVEVLDEVRDTARGLVHGHPRLPLALVGERDLNAAGEEGELLEPPPQDLPLVVGVLEDLRVGPEGDDGAGLLGGLPLLQPFLALPARVRLCPVSPAPPHLHVEPLRQGVHHGDPDAVEPAGDRVGLPIELPPGVERRQDDLHGRAPVLRLGDGRHGDPAAVVDDPDPPALQEGDLDLRAVAGEGLVDGVVDDLIDQVMEAPAPGGPDVHPRALANRLQALEDGDVRGRVVALSR